MATKTSTQDLANLVINKVESQTAYDQMVAAGQINANELYLVEGDIVPSPYTSNPAMDGIASPGSSTSYAKGDHVHPSDTSRAPVSHATSSETYGAGTGTDYGHLRLSDSTSSTSGTSGGYAATPSAVKSAYDLANGKQDALSEIQLAWYGTSSTTATTQTKATTITGITALTTGLTVRVKFSNAQTYNGQPKLQINSLTAKSIVRTGGTAAARYEWQAGEVVCFVYDGTDFIIQDGAMATTTYYGQTILSSATNSTSETVAATPSAVKAAYDLASGKANVYSMTFTTYNWSSQKITLNASTHGCGTAPMVQVQRLNGTNYEIYYGYPSTGWKVAIDSSGNITLSVPASGDEFSGRLVVR